MVQKKKVKKKTRAKSKLTVSKIPTKPPSLNKKRVVAVSFSTPDKEYGPPVKKVKREPPSITMSQGKKATEAPPAGPPSPSRSPSIESWSNEVVTSTSTSASSTDPKDVYNPPLPVSEVLTQLPVPPSTQTKGEETEEESSTIEIKYEEELVEPRCVKVPSLNKEDNYTERGPFKIGSKPLHVDIVRSMVLHQSVSIAAKETTLPVFFAFVKNFFLS